MKKILVLLLSCISVVLLSQQATLKTLSKPNYLDTLFLKNNITYMMNRNDSILFSKPIIGMSGGTDTTSLSNRINTKLTIPDTLKTALTIYVDSTAGNDLTGDGTVGLPYKTIYKALITIAPNVKQNVVNMVTVQLGIGTYDYTADCDYLLQQKIFYNYNIANASLAVTIKGTATTIDATTTFNVDPIDAFKYNASGTPTWTVNQYRNYFTKTASNIYLPIDSNSTNAIWNPRFFSATLTGIHKMSSKIILSSNQNITGNVKFSNLDITNVGTFNNIGNVNGNTALNNDKFVSVSFDGCYIHGATFRYIAVSNSFFSATGSIFEFNYANGATASSSGLILYNIIGEYNLSGISLRNINTANSKRNGNGVMFRNGSMKASLYNGVIIRGFYYGITAYTPFTVSVLNGSINSKYSIMVDNVNTVYNSLGVGNTSSIAGSLVTIQQQGTLKVTNTNYLFNCADDVQLLTNKIYYKGKFTSIYSPTTPTKTFIDPSNNRYVLVDSQDVSVKSDSLKANTLLQLNNKKVHFINPVGDTLATNEFARSLSSGGATDTNSLSNRINSKQNYSDTSTYDATRQWTKNWVNNKAGYLTTATTIYIDSLGNDITGDGTITKPYASIGRACKQLQNNYIAGGGTTSQIKFKIGKGTINVPDSDWYALSKLTFIGNNYRVFNIEGTYDTINTTTTWTAQASPTNYTYNAGNPVPTWATDQYKYYFVGNSALTSFYPIESNTANTAIIANVPSTASMKGIFKLRTILQCATGSGGLNYLNLPSFTITYVYLKLNTGSGSAMTFTCPVLITSSIVSNSLLNASFYFSNNSQQNNFNNSVFIVNYSTSVNFNGGFMLSNSFSNNLNGVVIDNSNASHNGSGLNFVNFNSVNFISPSSITIIKNFQNGVWLQNGNTTCGNLLIKDCSLSAFNISQSSATIGTFIRRFALTNLYIVNTGYLIHSTTLGALDYQLNNIYGTYTSLWTASSTVKQFANALYNYNLKIPNTYPEYAQYQTATMANNSTDSIAIGNKTYTRSINITYNITRGTNYRNGTLRVLNTGTALVVDLGSYIETADLGVTLNGVYFGGTTLNDIKLKWTTTNTGTGATITYDVNRQNY